VSWIAEPEPTSARPTSHTPDPYRGALLVLLGLCALGTAAAFAGGVTVGNPVILHAAATLVFATGVLLGVVAAQAARLHPRIPLAPNPAPPPDSVALAIAADVGMAVRVDPAGADESPVPQAESPAAKRASIESLRLRFDNWIGDPAALREIRMMAAGATAFAILFIYGYRLDPAPITTFAAIATAFGCLASLALAATAVRYCSDVDPAVLPEGFRLAQGARIVGWVSLLAAVSTAFQWAGVVSIVGALALVVLALNVALCSGLFTVRPRAAQTEPMFPLDIGVLPVLGERLNVIGSVLDAAERQLGIDLRSTWALTVVRRSVEPLVIALGLVGWLSTAMSIVGVEEQGLVERLGVPVGGPPLEPGLHLHWPWPIDTVARLPVRRVQALTVGHEGKEENGGPEDVLWARQHAANEYTLLLGNGRDLITVDAAVQYRIADPRAWRYHSQNPGDALRAIAHRAVMRTTVNRTLADALSENVVTTTARMRTMVQQEADTLGLGVEVLSFTVGGMHPPVAVAAEYQAVVSAELGKVTAVVQAEADRNRTVPFAEAARLMGRNGATAAGAADLAKASGEAWSFRTLQAQYRADAGEYLFRRRLETLELVLPSRRILIVDHRFQRDGGELWVTP
jgi:regulator of protease activity HflC (stomatin/prohibitin superfamily)